jgi:2-iminobutanoate/2-iminopropanoate deaminase
VPDSNETVYTGVAHHIGRYADACVVPAGGRTIYVSGTPGLTEDGKVPELFGDEVRQMFVNIEAALAKAGAAMSDVVSVRQWLTRADDLPEYVGLQKEFIKHEPAAMLSFIDGFVWPEIHVEVEVVAVVH